MSLLWALSVSPAAADVPWLSDVNHAYEVAARDRRPLLVYVTMSGCPHCTRMDQRTFTDPQLAAEIGETCVPVKIDAQRHSGFIKAHQVKAFPTLLLLSPDKTVIDRAKGYLTPTQVHQRLNAAVEASARKRRRHSDGKSAQRLVGWAMAEHIEASPGP